MEYIKNKYIKIGAICIFVVLIIVISIFFAFANKKITYKTLTATDGSFQINFPNIDYKTNTQENNEFVIDLYSTKEEMFFYATKITKSREIDLEKVANDDKEHYLKEKQNIREDSGIYSTSIKDYKTYEYHFVYTDSSYGKDFYCNVVWIETNNNLYILNFEVIDKNKERFQDIFTNIKNSFNEL